MPCIIIIIFVRKEKEVCTKIEELDALLFHNVDGDRCSECGGLQFLVLLHFQHLKEKHWQLVYFM